MMELTLPSTRLRIAQCGTSQQLMGVGSATWSLTTVAPIAGASALFFTHVAMSLISFFLSTTHTHTCGFPLPLFCVVWCLISTMFAHRADTPLHCQ